MIKKIIKKILPKKTVKYLEDVIGRRNAYKKYIKKIILKGNGQVSFSDECDFGEKVIVFGGVDFFNAKVGARTYFAGNNKVFCCKIGNFCSIARGVTIGLGRHPSRDFVSTHPIFYTKEESISYFADKNTFNSRLDIEIGNDVWIGENVLIKDGVKIGNGAIIGAGAVVVKDVDAYSIVGGVPAKLIRYRFTKKQINFLEKFKWWDKDEKWLKENWEEFSDINRFMKKFYA